MDCPPTDPAHRSREGRQTHLRHTSGQRVASQRCFSEEHTRAQFRATLPAITRPHRSTTHHEHRRKWGATSATRCKNQKIAQRRCATRLHRSTSPVKTRFTPRKRRFGPPHPATNPTRKRPLCSKTRADCVGNTQHATSAAPVASASRPRNSLIGRCVGNAHDATFLAAVACGRCGCNGERGGCAGLVDS